MIEETAKVVATEGEHAWVETERTGACGSCSASGGCGTHALSKVLGRRPLRMRVHNTVDAAVGERVVVGIPEDTLVRGSAAVYLAPLLAMMLAALLGEALGPQLGFGEGLVVLGGLAGLGLGFVWLRYFTRRIGSDARYQAVILRAAQREAFLYRMPQT